MTFTLGKTRLRFHWVLPFFWLISLATGGKEKLFPAVAAIFFHECGHFFIARLKNMSISEIEITPYGGVMKIENLCAVTPLSAFLIASAGPFFSMLGCFLAGWLARRGILSYSFAAQFARNNLFLFLINLMPVLPLDGGRMLSAILSRFFPRKQVTFLLAGAGYVLGIMMLGISVASAFQGEMALTPAFAGLYLIYAGAIERRNAPARYITSLIGRRQRLENAETFPVQWIAAACDMPAERLISCLHPGRQHMILLLSSDGMEIKGILEEKDYCEGIIRSPCATLDSFIKKEQEVPLLDRFTQK